MRRFFWVVFCFVLGTGLGGYADVVQTFHIPYLHNEIAVKPVAAPSVKAALQLPMAEVVGSPQNLRFLPADTVYQSDAPTLTFAWDAPESPAGAQFTYHISVVLPNAIESTIEPQTAQFYQPFSSSPLILPGEYTFKIHASVVGADPSAIVTRKLTIAQNEPTPTPILPVGEATEVMFSPSDTVYFSQSKELTVSWENPRWPQGAQFTYDVELTHRLGYTIFKQENVTTRSVQLFPEGWTTADPGAFYVSIQAHVAGLGSGYPTVHTVWLASDPVVIPTPTPIPGNPDISRDDSTDFTDLMLFALSYRTIDGNQGFERFADFATDGVINSKDLLQFMALYANRDAAKPQAPLWLYVEAPQFELMQAGDATICNPVGQVQIDFPPNEIPQNESCIFAFMYMTTFYFSPVPGAVDYIVTVDSDRISQEMSVKPTFQTAGSTMFNIQFSLFKEWVSLQVEAMFEDGTTSDKSDSLRIYAVE